MQINVYQPWSVLNILISNFFKKCIAYYLLSKINRNSCFHFKLHNLFRCISPAIAGVCLRYYLRCTFWNILPTYWRWTAMFYLCWRNSLIAASLFMWLLYCIIIILLPASRGLHFHKHKCFVLILKLSFSWKIKKIQSLSGKKFVFTLFDDCAC